MATGSDHEWNGDFSLIELAITQSLKYVPNWEEHETQNRTCKINVMTDAVLLAPVHARKQMQSFADVREHDRNKGARPDKLQKWRHSL